MNVRDCFSILMRLRGSAVYEEEDIQGFNREELLGVTMETLRAFIK